MTTKHQTYLENHCRLCAKSLGRVRHCCRDHSSFMSFWGVNPMSDSTDIQPVHFCFAVDIFLPLRAPRLKLERM